MTDRPDYHSICGCWCAYVAAGKTVEDMRERLAEVPKRYVEEVKKHVRTVFAVRKTMRKNAKSI
jgi:hypothetical protein